MTNKEKCESIHSFIQEVMNGTKFTNKEYENILGMIEDIREYFFEKENKE